MLKFKSNSMTKIVEVNKNVKDFLNCAREIQKDLDQSIKDTGYVGFVYLVKITQDIYKIGMSKNLGMRFEQLNTEKLRNDRIDGFSVLFLIKTNAPTQLEDFLRNFFVQKKVKGKKDHFYYIGSAEGHEYPDL